VGGREGGLGVEQAGRLSILNNLLMGLPSISNFGRQVDRAVVSHVSDSKLK